MTGDTVNKKTYSRIGFLLAGIGPSIADAVMRLVEKAGRTLIAEIRKLPDGSVTDLQLHTKDHTTIVDGETVNLDLDLRDKQQLLALCVEKRQGGSGSKFRKKEVKDEYLNVQIGEVAAPDGHGRWFKATLLISGKVRDDVVKGYVWSRKRIGDGRIFTCTEDGLDGDALAELVTGVNTGSPAYQAGLATAEAIREGNLKNVAAQLAISGKRDQEAVLADYKSYLEKLNAA